MKVYTVKPGPSFAAEGYRSGVAFQVRDREEPGVAASFDGATVVVEVGPGTSMRQIVDAINKLSPETCVKAKVVRE